MTQHAAADCFRITDELTIRMPALSRPTVEELRKLSPRAGISSIVRDTSPADAVTMTFATILGEGEPGIRTDEFDRRLEQRRDLILGFQHRTWLFEHLSELPKLAAFLGKVRIYFSGLVVRIGDEGCYSPIMQKGFRSWHELWSPVEVWGPVFGPEGRVAVSHAPA